ncbi:MAG: hypothetical protein IPL61_37205 [Myxococcales bacterium]|nr:hypothetical protein [Myxococcales bacterium]
MTTPRSLLELPFGPRPPLELLGLTTDRATIDLDYAGFGWARVDRVWLAGPTATTAVDDALIVAVHAADDGPALADDVVLEFALPDTIVTARLSTFLDRWLPRLPAAPAVVLALCNPHHAAMTAPAAAGDRPVHYGLGPVDAWLDQRPGADRLRLAAAGWRQAHRPGAPP